MAIGQAIERMDDRLDAIAAALTTALSTRVIKRSLVHYTDHADADLAAGVVTLLSAGEGGYSNGLGMTAKEGTHKLLLIGHLQLAESADGEAIEAAEIDLIEEIKAFVRSGVTGTSLRLENVIHSRQLERPYGWIVAYIDAGPPRRNTY